ncbi:MAG: DUF6702 family protein [Pseudomonadota bacterium]
MIRLFLTLLIGIAAIGGPALAHPQKVAVTQILFNDRTDQLEIAHRFALHDAENAAAQMSDVRPDLIGSAKARQDFAAYVVGGFSLRDGDDRPIALTLLGTEIEAGYLWVYQEATLPDGKPSLTIRQDALRDVWPEQTNLVTVEHGKVFRSLTFKDGAQALTVSLEN